MKRSTFRFLAAASALSAFGALLIPSTVTAADKLPPSVSPVPAPPTNVLLFPPQIPGATPDSKGEVKKSAREVQDIITDAIKARMTRDGVGTYVYDRQMPSVQRAVSENLIKAEAAANPTDDERVAMRIANTIGADEYVIADVSDYAYDETSHTATFSLSLIRKTVDGTQLGTVAEKAVGAAPADVAPSLQEGSAVARAAEVVAGQTVDAVFPMPKIETKGKKHRH